MLTHSSGTTAFFAKVVRRLFTKDEEAEVSTGVVTVMATEPTSARHFRVELVVELVPVLVSVSLERRAELVLELVSALVGALEEVVLLLLVSSAMEELVELRVVVELLVDDPVVELLVPVEAVEVAGDVRLAEEVVEVTVLTLPGSVDVSVSELVAGSTVEVLLEAVVVPVDVREDEVLLEVVELLLEAVQSSVAVRVVVVLAVLITCGTLTAMLSKATNPESLHWNRIVAVLLVAV